MESVSESFNCTQQNKILTNSGHLGMCSYTQDSSNPPKLQVVDPAIFLC